MPTYSNYIDGDWVEASTGETMDVMAPAAPDEVVATVQRSDETDVDSAFESAREAQDEWGGTPGPQRGRILRETAQNLEARQEELTELLSREEGKTLSEAGGEVGRAVNIFYYYAEKAREIGGRSKSPSSRNQNLYTVNEPLGVVGLITPWNYPIAIPAWKLAPALAAGNSVVLKPDSSAPTVASALFEALDEAGIPDGVANFVTGPGSTVGSAIVDHPDCEAVSFTGGRDVGEMVYEQATAGHKRIQTEMGSKNPTVITESADLDEAVDIVGSSAFGVTGQACTATERVLVHESLYDEFIEKFIDYADSLEIGPGVEDPDMGSHVNEQQLTNTLEFVERGKEEGATLAYGGERIEDLGDGYFVEPTIFTDVEPSMSIMQEEVFGPFVGVMPVSDIDEAIEISNAVEFGLSAGIITQNHTEANRYIDEADYGVVKVNEATTGLELHVPFGGMNASSSETYREQGDAALDFFTITKTVYDNY